MPATFKNTEITDEFLRESPNAYFVFGDNATRQGLGGAAKLRHNPKAIGFITKKAPNNDPRAFFTVEEFIKPFFSQLDALRELIKSNPQNVYYVSKLGAGLANRHNIWEKLIGPNLVQDLEEFDNVVFCWDGPITALPQPQQPEQ